MSSEESRLPNLTSRMMGRYQRQMVLPQVGIEGQERLMESRVLIVGAGALGSAAATYLAAAGVGTLGLVDGDTVDISNLHRQILHDESQVGSLKTLSGAARLKALNPDVQVQTHAEFLSSENTLELFSHYDLIVNGSDNFPARYLVNDAAVLLKRPLVDAAILRFEGRLAVYRPGAGCYRCLFPVPPPPGTVPDCAEAGILGAVAGVMGSMQAVEALKILLQIDQPESGTLLLYDALASSWHRVPFYRDSACAVCGDAPTITQLIDYEDFCGSRTAPHVPEPKAENPAAPEFSLDVEHAARLLEDPRVALIDVRSAEEFQRGHIPRAQHWALEDLDRLAAGGRNEDPIVVVCAMGVRSVPAAQYLRSRGYNAWTLMGGTTAWTNAGLPWVLGNSPVEPDNNPRS